MLPLRKGRYRARFAADDRDVAAAQALRAAAFSRNALDCDRFDALCEHVLIEVADSGELLCCFRLLPMAGQRLDQSYSGQFYDLSALHDFPGELLELGRFCVKPGLFDADILRLAFAVVAQLVDARDVKLLLGCSSFSGTDPNAHAAAFAFLQANHLAPKGLGPRVRADEVVPLKAQGFDRDAALRGLPPLLRSYLAMGGWVSDHAVVDRDLNTLHVFTAVEISSIPAERAETLRAVGRV